MNICKLPERCGCEQPSIKDISDVIELTDDHRLPNDFLTIDGTTGEHAVTPYNPEQLVVEHVTLPTKTFDKTDMLTYEMEESDSQSYTYINLLFSVVAIIGYIFDVGSDINLAYVYYFGREWWWFGLTVSFITIPSLIISCFSLAWYIRDHYEESVQVHPVRWIPRILMHVLLLGPVVRLVRDNRNSDIIV